MASQNKSGGQGSVKDPAHDGRLKQNRDQSSSSQQRSSGQQGRVKDPEHDGRLKQNR